MKCEQTEQNIALAAYGELAEDRRHALDEHLAACIRCREELQAVVRLQQAMSAAPVEEPSASLLAQTRVRLDELLETVPPDNWWTRTRVSLEATLAVLGRAPVAASTLLVLGLAGGGFSGYRVARQAQPAPRQAVPAHFTPAAQASNAPAKIAGVSRIARDPNSEDVEVQFNRLVPETVHGSMDDPRIRQLLVLAAESRSDPEMAPEVQQNSVRLLAEECEAGRQCSDGPVRQALLVALRYDRSPEVRLAALNGLQSYIPVDMRVRDAVLESLMKDADPAVRSRAIELIEPVEDDSSVREVLHTVASEDENPHIRTVSREVLDQLPQIQ